MYMHGEVIDKAAAMQACRLMLLDSITYCSKHIWEIDSIVLKASLLHQQAREHSPAHYCHQYIAEQRCGPRALRPQVAEAGEQNNPACRFT
jgi:hypothetical protein